MLCIEVLISSDELAALKENLLYELADATIITLYYVMN